MNLNEKLSVQVCKYLNRDQNVIKFKREMTNEMWTCLSFRIFSRFYIRILNIYFEVVSIYFAPDF